MVPHDVLLPLQPVAVNVGRRGRRRQRQPVPHDLDFLCWTAGMPSDIFAEMHTLGHDIEVEDDCIALFKWADGGTGTLHVTTNEHPGSSYVEIAGTMGALLLQGHELKTTQLSCSSAEYCLTSKEKFAGPPITSTITYEIPTTDNYLRMSQNIGRGDPARRAARLHRRGGPARGRARQRAPRLRRQGEMGPHAHRVPGV